MHRPGRIISMRLQVLSQHNFRLRKAGTKVPQAPHLKHPHQRQPFRGSAVAPLCDSVPAEEIAASMSCSAGMNCTATIAPQAAPAHDAQIATFLPLKARMIRRMQHHRIHHPRRHRQPDFGLDGASEPGRPMRHSTTPVSSPAVSSANPRLTDVRVRCSSLSSEPNSPPATATYSAICDWRSDT